MKKLLLFIALFSCSTILFSQQMAIKGVVVSDTYENFIKNIQEKGFEMIGEEGGTAMLKGTFAGCDDTYLIVASYEGLVQSASLMLKGFEHWKDAKSKYLEMQSSYEKKYNTTSTKLEVFQNDYMENTGLEYTELKNGRAYYKCFMGINKNENVILLEIGYTDEDVMKQMWSDLKCKGAYVVSIVYNVAEVSRKQQANQNEDL